MKKYINDLTNLSTFVDELDGIQCYMNGYDSPRYIDTQRGRTGNLGYTPWTEDAYTPTYNSDATGGSLDPTKYYAIRIVPVDTNLFANVSYVKGTPTTYSTPVQLTTSDTGTETAETSGYATDSSQAWTVDEWVGYYCYNDSTYESTLITANTATALTLTDDLSLAVDDTFSIIVGQTLTFDFTAHPDTTTLDTGDETAGTASTATDSSKEWTVDTWIDYECLNVETGDTATITSNTATALSLDADLSFTAGDRFQIITTKTTEYEIYAGEVSDSDDIVGAAWYYQGDSTDLTYSLDSMATSTVLVTDEYFPPENFKYCHMSYERLFAGGGITESRGKAHVELTDLYTVVGNTSGDDQTYFSQGMVNATIRLEGDSTVYYVSAVDAYAQTLTLSTEYTGSQVLDVDYEISSDYDLYYSDVRNPHVFRTENYIEISDSIKAFKAFGGVMVVFCSSSLWAVPLDNLGQSATQITDQIDFDAPYSIVYTPKGLFFWDGYGFSLTDGTSITSVTKYKANEFLKGMNSDMDYNIRGVYDRRNSRIEYAFAYGTEVTNNYGLIITTDSLNCYGIARSDVNALWTDKDSSGDIRVYHGTSGRHTTSGEGVVWEHDEDMATDGDIGSASYLLSVTAQASNVISASSASGQTNLAEGWPVLYMPAAGGSPRQLVADIVTETGTDPYTYDISVGDDFETDDIQVGDYLFVGGIPFDYGVKWFDFGSPQYQHKVRAVNLDTNSFRGMLFVDHYLDSQDYPAQTDIKFINPDDTHYTIPVKLSSGNTYGLRLRGVTIDKMKLLSMSVMFNTEV